MLQNYCNNLFGNNYNNKKHNEVSFFNLNDQEFKIQSINFHTNLVLEIPEKIKKICDYISQKIGNNEFSIFCKIKEKKENKIILSDFYFIPKQKVSYAFIDYLEDAKVSVDVVIHRHPDRCEEFSHTDNTYINKNFKCSILYTKEKGFIKAIYNLDLDVNNKLVININHINIFYDDIDINLDNIIIANNSLKNINKLDYNYNEDDYLSNVKINKNENNKDKIEINFKYDDEDDDLNDLTNNKNKNKNKNNNYSNYNDYNDYSDYNYLNIFFRIHTENKKYYIINYKQQKISEGYDFLDSIENVDFNYYSIFTLNNKKGVLYIKNITTCEEIIKNEYDNIILDKKNEIIKAIKNNIIHIFDFEGKEIITCNDSDLIYYNSLYFILKKGNKYGVISFAGYKLFDFIYDNVKHFDFNFKNIIALQKHNKYEIFNYNRKVINDVFDDVNMFDNESNLLILKKKEKYGLYSCLKDKFVLKCEYDEIRYDNQLYIEGINKKENKLVKILKKSI